MRWGVILLIIALIAGYGVYKGRQVALAVSLWDGQQIHMDTSGAAK